MDAEVEALILYGSAYLLCCRATVTTHWPSVTSCTQEITQQGTLGQCPALLSHMYLGLILYQ